MLKIQFENVQHEDEMWCTRAFQRNLTVTYLPEELYFYVMRSGSIIHSTFNRKKLDSFTVSETRIKTLSSLGHFDLLSLEYARLFKIILSLYREARASKDDEALKIIKEKFILYKGKIGKNKVLSGKFALIYKMMYLNYSLIELYYLYWKSIPKNYNS